MSKDLKRNIQKHLKKLQKEVNRTYHSRFPEVRKSLVSLFGENSREVALLDEGKVGELISTRSEIPRSLTLSIMGMGEIWEDKSIPAMVDSVYRRVTENLPKAVQLVSQAAKRAKVRAKIRVEPDFDMDSIVSIDGPVASFDVYVGDIEFTLFLDPVGVGDVLEDPRDTYSSVQEFHDYQKVISEIQSPGSSSSKKILTLYTARPLRDRKRYDNASDIPSGIFLTNKLDHAEGLAEDLSSGEKRDVYRIRVKESDVILTLDGRVKYYQATGTGKVSAEITRI